MRKGSGAEGRGRRRLRAFEHVLSSPTSQGTSSFIPLALPAQLFSDPQLETVKGIQFRYKSGPSKQRGGAFRMV